MNIKVHYARRLFPSFASLNTPQMPPSSRRKALLYLKFPSMGLAPPDVVTPFSPHCAAIDRTLCCKALKQKHPRAVGTEAYKTRFHSAFSAFALLYPFNAGLRRRYATHHVRVSEAHTPLALVSAHSPRQRLSVFAQRFFPRH